MKNILVPTDFSTCAGKALDYAVQLAKYAGAKILLMHACELLHSAFADKANMVNVYNELKTTELDERLNTLKQSYATTGVEIITRLYEDDATDAVLLVSQQNNIDLIVMGTLGATGLKTVLFGTKTATVIARSTVPVIAVPYNYSWKKPEKFLIAVNDAEQDAALFSPVFMLARLFGATIKMAVFTEKYAPAAVLMEHSKLISVSHETMKKHYPDSSIDLLHLTGRDFYETLQLHINKEKIDLLVMVTHIRSSLQNLFRFSMTRQMAYHTTVPMLSLHSNNDK